MIRPELKKLAGLLGGSASVLTVFTYLQQHKEPKNSAIIKELEKIRELAEQSAKNNNSLSNYENAFKNWQESVTPKTNSLDNLISRLKKGEQIDPQNDPDFKATVELRESIQDLLKSNPFGVNQGEAVSSINLASNTSESLSNTESNVINLINNNSLVSEITEYIKNYQEFLTTLTREQLGLVMNFVVSITVLLLVFSLITTFYSDLLIKHFNIETKYPRLGKFIILRRKFQNYYFFINSLLIIGLLIMVLFANAYGFINILSE